MGLFSTKKESAIAGLFGSKITREQFQPAQDSVKEQKVVEKTKTKGKNAPKPKEDAAPTPAEDSDSDAEDTKKDSKKPQLDEEAKKQQTVFFGNLNSSVILDKASFKEFKTFVRQAGPVVSVRFRSIAFSEILPRKAAYILQKLHPARDAVNAYVVYKTPEAATAALDLNGQMLQEHHVRVDSAANPAPQYRKRSVFLGNMDFEAKEEDVYRHFEACGPIEYVRLVRDAKTNVGKGFGYVQFKDSAAVSLAIMMNETPFNGRPLRVTHCKGDTKSKQKGEKDVRVTKARTAKGGRHVGGRNGRPSGAAEGAGATGGARPILEGERAKAGTSTSLRKRKPRHKNDPTKKKAKK